MQLELDSPLGPWKAIFGERFWCVCVHESDPLSAQICETLNPHSKMQDEMLVELFWKDWKSYWGYGTASFSDIPKSLLPASPFRQRVLTAAQKILPGECVSYRDLAQEVGSENAARAVGSALANNPLLLGVPCHRILPRKAALRFEHWWATIRPQLGVPCTNPSERFEILGSVIESNLNSDASSPQRTTELLVGEFRLGSFMKLILLIHERWV